MGSTVRVTKNAVRGAIALLMVLILVIAFRNLQAATQIFQPLLAITYSERPLILSNETGIAATAVSTSPTSNNNTFHLTATDNRTIFTCGFEMGKLREALFPEFQHEERISWKTPSNPDSVLFFGLWGPCPPTVGKSRLSYDWISSEWKGKTLFINGESGWLNASWGGGIYGLGSISQDTSNAIYSTFMGLSFVAFYDPETRPLLFDHSRKPQSIKQRFCIYPSTNCVDFRDEAADRVASVGRVYQGGECFGASGVRVRHTRRKERRRMGPETARWAKNYESFGKYMFCLVMENANVPGYVTEKILNAFLGGCIPIYYGTTDVFKIFNANAFVYYNISDPEPALARLKHLRFDQNAYDAVMRNEPILANGADTIEEYFSFSDEIGKGTLKRRIREKMGL